jgi:CyaY protein
MDESRYLDLADQTFRSIESALEGTDPDEVDYERAGDVLTLTFSGNRRCVLNTQRPTRQIWLAANARAWHFSYDEQTRRWVDDKGRNEELFATLAGIIKAQAGVDVSMVPPDASA